MTWIKICGTTNVADAKLAIEAGADAVGFVLHQTSPRRISADQIRLIIAELPDQVEKVGVFVDAEPQSIAQIAAECGLTAVQIYSSSAVEDLQRIWEGRNHPPRLILARSLAVANGDAYLANPLSPQRKSTSVNLFALLLDSGTAQSPGGTGQAFDWNAAAKALPSLASTTNWIVAGGLTPHNVADAMRILKPWGVDVVSGVEASPGRKDPEKLRAFIAAVRQSDQQPE